MRRFVKKLMKFEITTVESIRLNSHMIKHRDKREEENNTMI